jgi:hypothetical protein
MDNHNEKLLMDKLNWILFVGYQYELDFIFENLVNKLAVLVVPLPN